MSMTGYLSEFTLSELFQLVAEGNKSGLLTIGDSKIPHALDCHKYHIWFNQGQIIAAANSLDNRGLISLIEQRGWLNGRLDIIPTMTNRQAPLGLLLKSENLLQAEQLKLLFQVQIMQPITELFTWKTGWFNLKKQTTFPTAEMTGLSRSATEVLLTGLRSLRDWSALAEKLPDPNSGLISLIQGKPQVQLDSAERRIWEFAQGQVSIKDISKRLKTSVESVQQITLRLILANLVQEAAVVEPSTPAVSRDRSQNSSREDTFGDGTVVTLVKQNVSQKLSQSQSSVANNVVYRRTEPATQPAVLKPAQPAPSQNYLQNWVAFLRNKNS